MADFFNVYNIEEFLEAFADIFGVLGFFGSFLSLALFVLKGFGLYRMAKSLGINNSWLSFVPFADLYILGSIASKYIKKDGSKSAKFGIILPIIYAIAYVIAIIFFVVFIVFCLNLIVEAEQAMFDPNSFSLNLSMFIPVVITYIITLISGIIYKVLFFISLWRVFAIFDNDNKTIFLVLSILFSILAPIFIFIMRNNNPVIDSNLQNNYFEVDKM